MEQDEQLPASKQALEYTDEQLDILARVYAIFMVDDDNKHEGKQDTVDAKPTAE